MQLNKIHECAPSIPFHKTIGWVGLSLTISAIALSLIGLTATPSGPFKAIVQYGKTTHSILLGTSIFILALVLCKKKKEPPVSQAGSNQEPFVTIPSENEFKSSEAAVPSFPSNPAESSMVTKIDPVVFLPRYVSLIIFSNLNPNELGRSCCVSKKWDTLASDTTLWNALDLRKLSPLLKVFDESDWSFHVDLSKHGLSINDTPFFDKRKVIPVLKRYLASFPVEGDTGITLLTIPKGLTFNELIKLAGSPKVGNIVNFFYHNPISQLGGLSVDKTYRVVITNDIFKGSRNLYIDEQQSLLNKIGCEMPHILEATVFLVVTLISTGERLYNCKPMTYKLYSEHAERPLSLAVGGFLSNHFHVNSVYISSRYLLSFPDLAFTDLDKRTSEYGYGVGGVVKVS